MKVTLYKAARKSDKSQEWSIEVAANQYRTTKGYVGGKLFTGAWTTCQGKNLGKANMTTPSAQAQAEADAKIVKKRKEGYFDSIEESAQGLSYFEPMLAKKYFDRLDKVEYPVFVSTKLNGGRAIATKDGLFTRKGERWLACPHIEEDLKPFFDKFPDAVLDGELFNEDYKEKLNEMMEIIRKTVNISLEDLKKSREIVRFYIYDGFGFNFGDSEIQVLKDSDYTTRILGICVILLTDPLRGRNNLNFVSIEQVSNHEEVMAFYQKQIDDNQEGAMVRDPKSPYQCGRSAHLLKLKPQDSAEAIIVGVEEGKGNWSGLAKRILFKRESDGATFAAAFKGTMEQAKICLTEKDNWIGKRVTYSYNGFTGKGAGLPNYAQFDWNNNIPST